MARDCSSSAEHTVGRDGRSACHELRCSQNKKLPRRKGEEQDVKKAKVASSEEKYDSQGFLLSPSASISKFNLLTSLD